MMRYASEWQIFYRPKLTASAYQVISHASNNIIMSSHWVVQPRVSLWAECVQSKNVKYLCWALCNSRVQAEWKLLNPFFNSSTRWSEQLKIYGSEHCGCLRCVKAVWNMTGNLLRPLHWLCYSNSTPLLHIILKCLKGFNTGLKNDIIKRQKQ